MSSRAQRDKGQAQNTNQAILSELLKEEENFEPRKVFFPFRMKWLFFVLFFLLLNVSSKTSLHPQHIHDVLNIIFQYNVLQYRVKKLLLKVVLSTKYLQLQRKKNLVAVRRCIA